jgi:hypothetical protein
MHCERWQRSRKNGLLNSGGVRPKKIRPDRWGGRPAEIKNAKSALNLEILRRRFALVRDFLVFDDLPLIETAEASSFDRRDVDEHIFAAALWLNKPVSLLRVEPLHGTCSHLSLLPSSIAAAAI